MVKGISEVNQEEFVEERERVMQQRGRFQLHTRSIKLVKKGLENFKSSGKTLNLNQNMLLLDFAVLGKMDSNVVWAYKSLRC